MKYIHGGDGEFSGKSGLYLTLDFFDPLESTWNKI